ncbi:hypothetical protein [uncultured Gimesia sp.]|uniref:hypothetical protein n=1 Tax=uncultured Gimesia sp. TaxID=1678688 RepID=UPI0030DD1AF1
MSESKRSRFISYLGYTIMFLVIAYPLSVGPVVSFISKSQGDMLDAATRRDLQTFYAPLIYVAKKDITIANCLEGYVQFCRRKFR